MASQRTTFGKRQREQNKKDKARAKQERLAARRSSPNEQKGPPIAWDEAVQVDTSDTSDTSDTPAATPFDTVPRDDHA